jgi:hypothetical protein
MTAARHQAKSFTIGQPDAPVRHRRRDSHQSRPHRVLKFEQDRSQKTTATPRRKKVNKRAVRKISKPTPAREISKMVLAFSPTVALCLLLLDELSD